MLTSLQISNYALIDHLDLTFNGGFSVITGETGAGKSILLGALGLLQGNRADAKIIKNGTSKCVVEGIFRIEGLDVEDILREADIEPDGDMLIVRREIYISGKSRAFVNDTPATLTVLKTLGSQLIDIHSQHRNLLLTHETFLLETLDLVARNEKIRTDYIQNFVWWGKAEHTLQRLSKTVEQNHEDRDFWAFQLSQIEEAAFYEGEQEKLEAESDRLTHAEEIQSAFSRVVQLLQNDEYSVTDNIRSAASEMNGISCYLRTTEQLSERLESCCIELDDILNEVEQGAEDIEFDPKRLAFVDERLSLLYGLQKKHHVESIAELLSVESRLRENLEMIDHADERLAEAEQELAKAHAALQESAALLTASRVAAAKQVEEILVEGLQKLGMPSVQLQLLCTPRFRPERSGCDAVQFLFSANRQVPLQEVSQIASGGEIARLMLTLKALIASLRHLPTVVFDEIDTGVSGTMAERMGRVMQDMAQSVQVICITHLPQIAALGTDHYRVYKIERETGTTSHIDRLDESSRINEIAKMLSGAAVTEAALANARELLAQA